MSLGILDRCEGFREITVKTLYGKGIFFFFFSYEMRVYASLFYGQSVRLDIMLILCIAWESFTASSSYDALLLSLRTESNSIKIRTISASGKFLDATQEMIALGVCNIFGSFVRSMPVTGSFTRTAVNHASGVRTPLGGIFTGTWVVNKNFTTFESNVI